MPSLTDRVRTAVGMPSTTERALFRIVEELPVVPVGEAGPGLTAVRGTVAVHRDTVPEPVTPEACVYAQYEIRDRSDEGAGGVGYDVVEGRVDAVPFRVEDETGSVLVDLTDVEHSGSGRYDSPLDAPGPLPMSDGATRAFADSGDEFDEIQRERLGRDETPAALVHEVVHVQSTLRPGDAVYVLAEFERDGDGTLVARPSGGPFIVSDMGKSALAAALERRSGDVSGQFVRFLLFGLIAAVTVLIVAAIGVALVVSLL